MKGRYIGAGVRTDCQNLIAEFVKLKTLRFDKFCKVWVRMKFSLIFCERKSFDELIEFTEECFRIAKDFWVEPGEFSGRVGGLYLLYGLYFKQPTGNLVKIRITLDDYKSIQSFHDAIRQGAHFDVNFVLSKMMYVGAFQYCATTLVYGLEKKFRKYFESDRSLLEVKKDLPAYLGLINNATLNQVGASMKDYHETKCLLQGGKPPETLTYTTPNIADQLREKLQKIADSVDSDSTTSDVPVPGASSVRELKNMAWWLRSNRNPVKADQDSESSEEEYDDLSDEKADEFPKDMPDISM